MTKSTKRDTQGSHYNFVSGILPVHLSQIPQEIIAGITLAALAIPEVMGYAQIAGMPVVTGLYTILIPTALYSLFGSSRHLVVGADSATAAIMAAGISGMAANASPEYVAYAGILALLVALFLFIARLVKLGFLADFLSKTVLIGFLTGVGIQVSISQISGMLGIHVGGKGPVLQLVSVFQQISQTNLFTLAIALFVLGIIFLSRLINRKIPGPLIAVIAVSLISYLFNLSQYGITVLGSIPSGLPAIGIPTGIMLNTQNVYHLLGIAFTMFIVILTQSAATSRVYAARYKEKFNENKDLVGLGLANIGAGLSGTFVSNGSPTKTQMVDSAGGRTQLSSLTASVITLMVLLFLTKSMTYMPRAVISTVVFFIGIEMIDLQGMRRILKERPVEFWVALITVIVVVFVGIEQGILLAILLSIFIHTRHGYKPKNAIITFGTNGKPYSVPVELKTEILPGLMIYRFNHSMYYANTGVLEHEILQLLDKAQPPIKWFCIDTIAVDDIDFSAAETLRDLHNIFKQHNVRLVFASVDNDIHRELDLSGITSLIGNEAYFDSPSDVIETFRTNENQI
jgi:high affinity sulfate transporter 1